MANYAYNAMPKTGLYLLMPPDMSMVSQVLRPKKVKYDARKFKWLGRVFGSNNLIAVRRDAGVTNVAQAKAKQVIMGSTGKGSPTFIVTALANGLVGTKFKIVQGYRGSARTKQAMEQGEVLVISLAWASWKSDKLAWFTGSNSFALGLIQSGGGSHRHVIPHRPRPRLAAGLPGLPGRAAPGGLLEDRQLSGIHRRGEEDQAADPAKEGRGDPGNRRSDSQNVARRRRKGTIGDLREVGSFDKDRHGPMNWTPPLSWFRGDGGCPA